MTDVLVDEVDVPHLESERDDLSLVALSRTTKGGREEVVSSNESRRRARRRKGAPSFALRGGRAGEKAGR